MRQRYSGNAKLRMRDIDFNVAVLRWTWRVGHCKYRALGTDR